MCEVLFHNFTCNYIPTYDMRRSSNFSFMEIFQEPANNLQHCPNSIIVILKQEYHNLPLILIQLFSGTINSIKQILQKKMRPFPLYYFTTIIYKLPANTVV